jgi:uncharacterized protein
MNLPTIPTPCVGICSTALGDNVCRGCKRYAHEVIDWNSYTYEQKAAIEARLTGLLTTIIQSKWLIVDESKLKFQLTHQPVAKMPTHRNLYCQSLVLIKTGASSIHNIDDFGLLVLPEWQDVPLKKLCLAIDQEFFSLSVAHYDRYYQNFV